MLIVERLPDRVVATLSRPETRNAIDQELIDALHALCAELEAELFESPEKFRRMGEFLEKRSTR